MSFIKNKIECVIIAVILFMLWPIFITSATALDIIIDEKAHVSGDTIILGDIASFHPSDDRRIPGLMELEISASPSPGNSFRLNERFSSGYIKKITS